MQNQIQHLVSGTDLLPALSTGKEKILSYRILRFKYLPPGIHHIHGSDVKNASKLLEDKKDFPDSNVY